MATRTKATQVAHVAELSDEALVAQLREELGWRIRTRETGGGPPGWSINGGHVLLTYLADEYLRRHGD